MSYGKDVHRTEFKALTIARFTHSPYTTKIARLQHNLRADYGSTITQRPGRRFDAVMNPFRLADHSQPFLGGACQASQKSIYPSIYLYTITKCDTQSHQFSSSSGSFCWSGLPCCQRHRPPRSGWSSCSCRRGGRRAWRATGSCWPPWSSSRLWKSRGSDPPCRWGHTCLKESGQH